MKSKSLLPKFDLGSVPQIAKGSSALISSGSLIKIKIVPQPNPFVASLESVEKKWADEDEKYSNPEKRNYVSFEDAIRMAHFHEVGIAKKSQKVPERAQKGHWLLEGGGAVR